MDVLRSDFYVPSSDGVSTIRALHWEPSGGTVRAVVQIVHGMSEHIERYDEFATYLVQQGFAVVGHDHIGHGKSALSIDELGVLPAENGSEVLVIDTDSVRRRMRRFHKGVPYFVFGHSMGSFVVRKYAARYGKTINGVIVCGTGNTPLVASIAGRTLARFVGAVTPRKHKPTLLHGMVEGSFASSIKDARTPNDWISHDEAVVDAYTADSYCGQRFSTGGYVTLTDLAATVVTKRHAKKVLDTLPMLFIAGDEDPVGNCGKDVEVAANLYRSQGVQDVQVIMYPGMRHEILNEPGHAQVFQDVVSWLDVHVAPKQDAQETTNQR